MRYLTLKEVLDVHRQIIMSTGGALGILNLNALESSIAQLRMTFGLEIFLVLNGFEIAASLDEQEQVILRVASGELEREQFTAWLAAHTTARS